MLIFWFCINNLFFFIFTQILDNIILKCTQCFVCTFYKIKINIYKNIVDAKPKNEHMILGHQEALPKHLHHSWSQSIQFLENWHICLKTGQVICPSSEQERNYCHDKNFDKPLVYHSSLQYFDFLD